MARRRPEQKPRRRDGSLFGGVVGTWRANGPTLAGPWILITHTALPFRGYLIESGIRASAKKYFGQALNGILTPPRPGARSPSVCPSRTYRAGLLNHHFRQIRNNTAPVARHDLEGYCACADVRTCLHLWDSSLGNTKCCCRAQEFIDIVLS